MRSGSWVKKARVEVKGQLRREKKRLGSLYVGKMVAGRSYSIVNGKNRFERKLKVLSKKDNFGIWVIILNLGRKRSIGKDKQREEKKNEEQWISIGERNRERRKDNKKFSTFLLENKEIMRVRKKFDKNKKFYPKF
jgi:hypothetical protein